MHPVAPAAYIAALALAVAASWLLVSFVLRHAGRFGLWATPGERQSHDRTTPTGAGLGLVLALIITSVLLDHYIAVEPGWLLIVLPVIGALAVVGALDDRYTVSAGLRLLIQFAVSFVLLGWLDTHWLELDWWHWLIGATTVVWVMNVYNFMDGSHGMAGFQGVFAGLVLFVQFARQGEPALALPALLLAGVCAGFLPLNFPVARIFMGDAGSVPLGFALAALIGLGFSQGGLSLAAGLLVLSVFLVDTTLTLFKRVIGGEQWYTAHKQHIYQRLIDHGWPHSRVLLLYQAINLVLVAPAIVLAGMYPELAWGMAGMVFLLLTTGWVAASLRLGMRK